MKFREAVHSGPMIVWSVNQKCNFSCSYCFSTPIVLSKEHPSCGKYSPNHIAQCFNQTGETWWIYMSGGEPFLYPDFVNLCSKLTDKHYITINTNLSTKNCIEFADKINPEKVYSINASLHIAERKKRNLLSGYIKHVKYFQEKGFQVRTGYVVHPSLFQGISNDIKMLREEGIEIINLKTFRGFYNAKHYPEAYTKNERDIIAEYAIDKKEIDIIDKTFSFFGKACKAGLNFFVMDPAGKTRRCSSTARSYGNFFEGSFTPDKEPQPCTSPKCFCPYEGMERTSESRCNYFEITGAVLKEAPSFIRLKARPTKVIRYLKKRSGLN